MSSMTASLLQSSPVQKATRGRTWLSDLTPRPPSSILLSPVICIYPRTMRTKYWIFWKCQFLPIRLAECSDLRGRRIDKQGLLDRVFPLNSDILNPPSTSSPSTSKISSDSFSLRNLLKEAQSHPLRVLRVSPYIFLSAHPTHSFF